jgi:hypothetical protein
MSKNLKEIIFFLLLVVILAGSGILAIVTSHEQRTPDMDSKFSDGQKVKYIVTGMEVIILKKYYPNDNTGWMYNVRVEGVSGGFGKLDIHEQDLTD